MARRNAKKFAGMIGVTLVALALVGLATIEPRFEDQSVVLSDGSTLTLRSVTHGLVHTPPSAGWSTRLYRLLPETIRRRWVTRLQPRGYARTQSESFGIWIDHIGAKDPYGGPTHLWARVLEQEGDCSFELKSSSWTTGQTNKKSYFVPVKISSQNDTVTLGVFEMPDYLEFQEFATFKLKNPLNSP